MNAEAARAKAATAAKVKAPRAEKAKKPQSQQITITLPPDVLQRLNALALEMAQSRAGLIKMGVYRLLKDGI